MEERTLIILKPDTIQRGLIGEIISRFERVGLKIVGMKMVHPERDHYYKHYEDIGKMITRRGEKAFEVTLDLMMQGPVIAIVLEGPNAVKQVRKMVGTTAPEEAEPGTIRGDYAMMGFGHADKLRIGVPNIVHASGDPEEAKEEIGHWFSADDMFEYQTVHEKFTRGEAKVDKKEPKKKK